MKVLSVQNPYSYLICYGVKDVENRTFNTKQRGKILIHTSLKEACNIFSLDKELLLFNEFNKLYLKVSDNEYEALDYQANFNSKSQYFEYSNNDKMFGLRKEYESNAIIKKEYELLKHVINGLADDKQIFLRGAIIGQVDIVDVVKNSGSKWATSNNFHYVLENGEIFDKPILEVKGQLGFWNYKYS